MTITSRNFPALEVHWGGPDGTRDQVVGYLEFDGSQWTFNYAEDMHDTSLGFDGFHGLPNPPVGSLPTQSANLFPAFAGRIPALKRQDVIRSSGDLTTLPREEAFYEFLRRTGGRTGTDHIWFSEISERIASEEQGLGKPLRNEIRKMVVAIRRVLEDDVREQLEGTFGVLPDGRVLDITQVSANDAERRRDREAIEAAIEHEVAGGRSRKDAVEQFTREVAFTCLNRLAALKLMEARGLIQESISKGPDSSGFRLFKRVCEEVCRAHADGGYRKYLEFLFDDIAGEIKVLFDRSLPHSRIFPRAITLTQAIDLLNKSCPPDVWKSDETIGWVYQYFTPKEIREALRDTRKGGSQAPRNSYELAVRNQFYTPRYVVQFLADNTLGRTWFEMRKGNTRLADACRYLVRWPKEVFLRVGESTRREAVDPDGSQERVLQRAVYIPHRSKKDPREILILDPACGSGHFLLYAFDLLLLMYEEAWADPEPATHSETGRTLREDYPDLDSLRRELSGLILRHNLYGVDIDLRATQIAALALWLRVQRAYQELGLRAAVRPAIRRSNIVCAEPMPGARALLDEFLASLEPGLLRQLVRIIFDKMQLAGEAGSLLKIDEEIREAIAEARRQWTQGTKHEQILLWPEAKRPKPEQGVLFDTRGITDETFWHDAELRVLEQLRAYAEQAENGRGIARNLFAEDAVQGFAFIDLCRKRFDVVLMNPPFGDFSKHFKEEARSAYPNTYNDIFAAFVDRFLDMVHPRGFVGAISSRTGFFLTSFVRWRQEVVLKKAAIRVLVDLGPDVMDEAMVEAAAYALERVEPEDYTPFIRVLGIPDRIAATQQSIRALRSGRPDGALLLAAQTQFDVLVDSPFAYWVPEEVLRHLAALPTFEPSAAQVRQGLVTGDNPRFVRALWEVPPASLGVTGQFNSGATWAPLVMKGPSQPWYSPLTVVLKWKDDGAELHEFVKKYGSPSRLIKSKEFYFHPGLSWTRRAVRFIPYAIPRGCIPTASRYMAFPRAGLEFAALGVTASNIATAFLRFYGEWFTRPNYLVETVKVLPFPSLPQALVTRLEEVGIEEVSRRRRAYQNHEPFQDFTAPTLLFPNEVDDPLGFDLHSILGSDLESEVGQAYGVDEAQRVVLERDLNEAIQAQRASTNEATEGNDEQDDEEEDARDFVLPADRRSEFEALVSYSVGCAFGRWDLRIGRAPSLAPKVPDPFNPLPVCPLGMLVGPDGLPARSGQIVSDEWLCARREANALPPAGSVKNPTIVDNDYLLKPLPWDGVLVDDEGHPGDVVTRVREVFRILWPDRSDDVERQTCEILETKDLRSYFRNPRNFFGDHIKRYTKSRRRAPIYWLLQTTRKSYGLWLYYHRLTRDTLFHTLQTYIDPKLQHEEARRHELRRMYEDAKAGKVGKEERRLAKEMDTQENLLSELLEFKAKIEAVAYGRMSGSESGCRGWDPDLNDGVILSIAPLSAVVPWKEAAKTWQELVDEQYDWSHVATCFWPQRVDKRCGADLSIAIAHGRKVD